VLECLSGLPLMFNSIAKRLNEGASYGQGKITNPHLSPLLTSVSVRYFGKHPAELASLEGSAVVIKGPKARRLAAQYVYIALTCAKRFLEKGEVCSYFSYAFSVPEEKLAALEDLELPDASAVEAKLEELARSLAKEEFESYSDAKRRAEELAEGLSFEFEGFDERCVKRAFITKLASMMYKPKGVKLEEVRKAVLMGDLSWLPPCMRRLLERLKRGENLSHFERFALAAFLLNGLGMSVDEALSLFSSAPDFNERIARYQLEHVAGLRGSMKRYSPPSCARLKAEGVCVSSCGVRNPVQFVKSRSRR